MASRITIKSPAEIALLRAGGKKLGAVLRCLADAVRPGITTHALDILAERMIREQGGIPVFKGYSIKETAIPFPASICTSINDEVVHGIPRADRVLKERDIISIDIGMRWQGMVTDTAMTMGVGRISHDAGRLIQATEASLRTGIAVARLGNTVGDIGHAIGTYLKKEKLAIIRDLAGHGVGYELHEPPLIPNYGSTGLGPVLTEGMVIAIEPMATLGGSAILLDDDEWTFRTADHSLAAHFEHTILITKDKAEVLTQ
ncbi:MAG: type I methionyl aminopeptidase [Patescibacteria group bacterium]